MQKIINQQLPEGLIMIAASGIGQDLEIPKTWNASEVYAKSKNALLIDHRGLSGDIYTNLEVDLAQTPPSDAKELVKANIETPLKRLYIGDHQKEIYQIIEVLKEKQQVIVYGHGNESNYKITVVLT